MRLDYIGNAFQLVASIAVVVGLALVVLELRQAKQLTGAQLIATNYEIFSQREQALLGEEPADAIVRSCLDPDSMTDTDLRVLASYYQQLLLALSGMIEVELAGEFGTDRWRPFASYQLLNMLTTKHGRWYWDFVKPSLYPDLRALGDQIVADTDPNGCAPFWESFRTRTPLPPDRRLPEPG